MARLSLSFWISAWMAAGALDKLDFAYSFEETQADNKADVLSGMAYLYASLDKKFIGAMGRVMAGVAMDICNASRAIGESYQDINSLGKIIHTINIQFHVLAKKPHDCQTLFRLIVKADTIAKLLEQQMRLDDQLDEVDVASLRQDDAFSAHLNLPSIGLRSIVYPKAMAPLPEAVADRTLSDKEMRGQNITSELIRIEGEENEKDASCTAVHSGCVCISMRPNCSWGTTTGGFGICVESNVIPSGFTAVTDDCIACHSPGCTTTVPCSAYGSPCTCVKSKSDCTWNRKRFDCVEKATKVETEASCDLCSRQTGCSPPVIDFFQPAKSSFAIDQFSASFNTDMRLTGRGRVMFQCEDIRAPIPVPDHGLSIYQGKTLMINGRTAANDRQRRCELLIDEGALFSSDNISFLGFPCPVKCGAVESYLFLLNDNQGPQIISTIPQSGALGVKSTILQIIYDERIQYTEAFVARLWREETDELVAEFQKGPQVTLEQNKISIDIGSHEPGAAYYFEMPKESLQDVHGNILQKSLGNHTFSFTLAQAGHKVEIKQDGLSPVTLGLIIGGAALVVLVIGALLRMQTVRKVVSRRFSMRGSRRISQFATFNGSRISAFNFRISGAFNLFSYDNDKPHEPQTKKAWSEPKEFRKWDMSPKQLETEVRKQRQEKKNQEKRERLREEAREAEEAEARAKEREEARQARKMLIKQMGFDAPPQPVHAPPPLSLPPTLS